MQTAQLSQGGLLVHVQYKADADHFTSANALKEIPASLPPDVKGATTVSLDDLLDSDVNICLAGPKQLTQLGLTPQQLCPCNKQVKAISSSTLTCTGWIPIKFELEKHATTQLLFICNKVDRLFFSEQGCIELSILPLTFPRPMIMPHPSYVSSVQLSCSPPPEPPPQLLYPATPENVPKLEAYLRE